MAMLFEYMKMPTGERVFVFDEFTENDKKRHSVAGQIFNEGTSIVRVRRLKDGYNKAEFLNMHTAIFGGAWCSCGDGLWVHDDQGERES